ncbi:hypothetical protein ABID94_000269 [Streptomyces sp. PvR018]
MTIHGRGVRALNAAQAVHVRVGAVDVLDGCKESGHR